MARANSREISSSDEYATAADFEQIFTEDMSGLYLLSFLLTGDRNKAEECFVGGIGESTKGNKTRYSRSGRAPGLGALSFRVPSG